MTRRILVCDDDETTLAAIHAELPWDTVYFADSPECALQVIEETDHLFGVIVDVDGSSAPQRLDLLRRARLRHPKVRCVAIARSPDALGAGELMTTGLVHRLLARPWQPGAVAEAFAVSAGRRPTLLIVDPDQDMCETLRSWLSNEYDLVFCHDGETALESAALVHPDGVLMETELPKLTGPSLAWVFRNDPRYRELPLVVMGRDVPLALARADTHIDKPFSREDIIGLMARRLPLIHTVPPSAARPDEPEDRRLTPRSTVSIPGCVDFGTRQSDAIITSLSLSGAFVVARNPILPGGRGALLFHTGSIQPFRARFRVIRTTRRGDRGGMALHFEDLPPASQDTLRDALDATTEAAS